MQSIQNKPIKEFLEDLFQGFPEAEIQAMIDTLDKYVKGYYMNTSNDRQERVDLAKFYWSFLFAFPEIESTFLDVVEMELHTVNVDSASILESIFADVPEAEIQAIGDKLDNHIQLTVFGDKDKGEQLPEAKRLPEETVGVLLESLEHFTSSIGAKSVFTLPF